MVPWTNHISKVATIFSEDSHFARRTQDIEPFLFDHVLNPVELNTHTMPLEKLLNDFLEFAGF
jgi:hypothetical protein